MHDGTHSPPTQSKHLKNPVALTALVAVLVALLGSALYLTQSSGRGTPLGQAPGIIQRQGTPNSAVSSTTAQSVATVASATPSQTGQDSGMVSINGTVATFHGLGIQFTASTTDINAKKLPFSVNGTTVTIGALDGIPYYFTVFSKSASTSLQEAITAQFLTGYSTNNCSVVINTNLTSAGYPASFESAKLVPISGNEACPPDYTSFDQNRFFLMDTKHPTTLVLIEANQTNIDKLINGKSWYQTISFY